MVWMIMMPTKMDTLPLILTVQTVMMKMQVYILKQKMIQQMVSTQIAMEQMRAIKMEMVSY